MKYDWINLNNIYSDLKLSDIVFVSLKGVFDKKKNVPSSEWHFHRDIYKNKKNVNAIVHSHSRSCVTLACIRKKIPLNDKSKAP